MLLGCTSLLGDFSVGAGSAKDASGSGTAAYDDGAASLADVSDGGSTGAGDGNDDGTVGAADVSESGFGESGDAHEDGVANAGMGVVAVIGAPCSSPAALSCAGHAQKVTLICSSGSWALNQTCPQGSNCDSSPGANAGTCAPVLSLCANLSPGAPACGDATHVVNCGPDLVSESAAETCANAACIAGSCAGVCAPSQTQCASSGNAAQTCGPDGQWGTAVTCTSPCQNGVCQCPAGQTACGGACVNELTDANNCGGCGVRCAAAMFTGETCQSGACGCPAGTQPCSSSNGSSTTNSCVPVYLGCH
jgi:hypothetical protein